jgi:hypothetical protein
MANIAEERVVDHRCLGCTPFLIYWMNILDESVSRTPLRIFASVEQMRVHEMEIKDELCCMLNSGGGLLLFDCEQQFEKVLVKGHSLTEKEKELYEQRFYSYLDVFEPKMEVKKCVKISYVPVFQSPYDADTQERQYSYSTYASEEGLIKQHQSFRVRECLRGTYVMRVRISPVDPTTVFYWNENTNAIIEERYKNYLCSVKERGVKKDLKMKAVAKEIKKRMREHYLPERLTPAERRLKTTSCSYFDHECKMPETGLVIVDELVPAQRLSEDGLTYSYASMLVTSRSNLPSIVKAFRNEGIEVKCETKFDSLQLKAQRHSAIMYHNAKFEQIYRTISQNGKFVFGSRTLLAISITNFLKLENHSEQSPYYEWQFDRLV